MIDKNHIVADELVFKRAEEVYDGWFAGEPRVDWDNFLDKLEDYAGIDLGEDMLSPNIKAIKRHVANYRKMG
jgi:hypothetical protein